MKRTYQVTVKLLREYSATIAIRAHNEDEADRLAIAAFNKWWFSEHGGQVTPLGFPWPWKEHERVDRDPEIDTRFRCVDCGKDTGGEAGEYYSVGNDVWAASGLAPNGGMLCLVCLERRIGRPLTNRDFTCMWPSAAAWERLIAARTGCTEQAPPEQLEIWPAAGNQEDLSMDNVVKFPDVPEWASAVDAKFLDWLIAKGYLKHRQRHDWCAVEMAVNNAFVACVFDPRPELSPHKVIEHMLRHFKAD